MHIIWQTVAGEIAVIGVFVDLDNGVETTTAAPAAENLRRRHHPHSRRQEPEPSSNTESSFGGISGFLTLPIIKSAGVQSNLLEAVFTNVEEISTPGSAVKTQPLVMSELVGTLAAGLFQRLADMEFY